jgi:hypothetical protein
LRDEFLTGKVFVDLADAQARLDVWVREYNEVREHQSIGDAPPIRRFELRAITAESPKREPVHADPAGAMPDGATRRVSKDGKVTDRVVFGLCPIIADVDASREMLSAARASRTFRLSFV